MEKITKDELLKGMKLNKLNDEDLEMISGGAGSSEAQCIAAAENNYKNCVEAGKSAPGGMAAALEQCRSIYDNSVMSCRRLFS